MRFGPPAAKRLVPGVTEVRAEVGLTVRGSELAVGRLLVARTGGPYAFNLSRGR
jgi:hypothetical protein